VTCWNCEEPPIMAKVFRRIAHNVDKQGPFQRKVVLIAVIARFPFNQQKRPPAVCRSGGPSKKCITETY
jgi:hypothetical protein